MNDMEIHGVIHILSEHIENYARLLRDIKKPCPKCGQVDKGQTGEYPCDECGLPTAWDDKGG